MDCLYDVSIRVVPNRIISEGVVSDRTISDYGVRVIAKDINGAFKKVMKHVSDNDLVGVGRIDAMIFTYICSEEKKLITLLK
jgi:hypothetical protein